MRRAIEFSVRETATDSTTTTAAGDEGLPGFRERSEDPGGRGQRARLRPRNCGWGKSDVAGVDYAFEGFIGETTAVPSASDYFVADLKPGRCLAVCFIDTGTTSPGKQGEGRPHFVKGMKTELEVSYQMRSAR